MTEPDKFKSGSKPSDTQSFLKELLDHMVSAVVVYEAVDNGNDFLFKDINSSVERIEGIDKKNIIGRHLLKTFPFLIGSEIFSVIKDVWQSGDPGRCLVKLAPEGRFLGWRDFNIYKLATGEVVAIYEDVTEKMEKEARISSSNALLTSLIDSIPDLIFYKDKASVYIGCNTAFSKFAGKPVADIIGKTDYDLFDRTTAAFFRQKDREMLDRGTPRRNEEWVTYPDGSRVLLDTLKTPYCGPDREILGLIGISRDITATKRAEQQLIRQASAMENAIEEIVITDVLGNIEYVNPAFEKITGYAFEEVLGKNPRILKSGKQDKAFYRNLWQTILNGHVWSGQITNRTKSGTLVDLDATISPILDARKQIIGFVSVKRDVTKQLKMENQMRESQKMEAIGNLAGGIAHDFNNILTAILGYTDLALMSISDDDKNVEDLLEIKNAGNRAKDLVGQILTFSRRSEEELAPQKIQSIVKEAVKMLRASLPATVEIQNKINADTAPIMANPTQIHQIVMNLSTNAFHAMPNQQGTLSIMLDDILVGAGHEMMMDETMPRGRYILLRISDTGTGIDPAIRSRIFEPYFTTKEQNEGTGLGLAVVQGIVRDHKGFITVDSKTGRGTDFSVYFPAIAFDVKKSIEKRAKIPGGTETILLIDDEVKILDIGKRTFEKLGYTVHAFRNSTHAVHFFKNHPDDIDVVITDMTMPRKTGLDVTNDVLELRPAIPIIMCTGFSDILNPEQALEIGIDVYIMKPIEYNELAVTVRELLDQKKQEHTNGKPQNRNL